MAKIRTVWMDIGFFPYQFGFCPSAYAWKITQETSRRDLGPYPPPNPKACCTLLRNYRNGQRVAIVTVGDFAPQVVVDLLIHEAVHVWQDLRAAVGEKKPSSEFEAYTIQHVTAQLFTAYQKTRGALFIRR